VHEGTSASKHIRPDDQLQLTAVAVLHLCTMAILHNRTKEQRYRCEPSSFFFAKHRRREAAFMPIWLRGGMAAHRSSSASR